MFFVLYFIYQSKTTINQAIHRCLIDIFVFFVYYQTFLTVSLETCNNQKESATILKHEQIQKAKTF